jgi:FixJ family two-component response regulator
MALVSGMVALIDDEESVRRALKRLLRVAAFEVETYSSGAEFLAALGRRTPDCVIADVHMPGLSGFDVLEQVVARHRGLPVILVTAFDDPDFEPRARNAGAYRFLRKPVPGETLIEVVRSAIGLRG